MGACEEYIVLISTRLDGPLSQEEERELEAHLAQCPDCRALADELARLHAAFADLEELPAPEGFARGVMEGLDGLERREADRKKVVPLFARPQIKALAGLAACAVLCIGLYGSGLWRGGSAGDAANEMGKSDVTAQFCAPDAPDQGGAAAQTEEDSIAAPAEGDVPPPGERSMTAGIPPPEAGEKSADAGDGMKFGLNRLDAPLYELAGRTVDGTLTLARLPDGAEEILGGDVEWLTDGEGRAACILTGEQAAALTALAQAQGLELTGPDTGEADGESLWALVLTE